MKTRAEFLHFLILSFNIYRQWFINTDQLKESAMSALENVKFHPPHSLERMKSVLDCRTYWCISRQRVWGVPIPVFYHKYAY